MNNLVYKQLMRWYLLVHLYMVFVLLKTNCLMSVHQPVMIIPRLDISQNLFFSLVPFEFIIQNPILTMILDGIYLCLPLLLFYVANQRSSSFRKMIAVSSSVYLLIYGLLIDSTTPIHYEPFIAIALFSLVFYYRESKGFYIVFHCYRYVFLYIFFSAGLWKLRTGAIFNLEQMSAILVMQHADILISNPESSFSRMIAFLIEHQSLSYLIYAAGTVLELIFAIGFFTKKMDRVLFIGLILFIILDDLVMNIDYFPWMAYGASLWYSRQVQLES